MAQHSSHPNPLHWDFEYAFRFKKTTEKFNKLWSMKSSARNSLKDWLAVSDIDPKTAEICANACSEMIENCIKYTAENTVATVAIHVNNNTITIETINAATPDHRSLLSNSVTALGSTDDPKQLFVEKLLHPGSGKSHLGLIKIVMETKGQLEVSIEEEDALVHVKLTLQAR